MKKLLYLFLTMLIFACNSDDNNNVIAPIVTLIGESSITVSQYSTYVDAGATASDDVDGDLTANIETTSDVDTNIIGTYTVTHSVSNALGNVGSVSRQVDVGVSTPIDKINVLWQSPPKWDSTTAMKVATINPDKFIISIDGGAAPPGTTAGPSATQLVQFVTYLTTYGYTGELVMHPDVNKDDFAPFWHPRRPNDTTSTGAETWQWLEQNGNPQPWTLYIDYFKQLNDSLNNAGQKQMTELLIETGNGTNMVSEPNLLFPLFKSYINQIGLDSSIKLSATGDWHKDSFPTSADYYYAQMYDMCYIDTTSTILCGVNIFSTGRAKLIAESMVPAITAPDGVGNNSGRGLGRVSFIFTYAPTSSNSIPGQNSPMFGEGSNFWTKSQFTNGTIMENGAIKQTGFIWWFKTKMKTHYSDSIVSSGLWHSEAILDPRWEN
ncbi:MAG: DUF5011 domain-containing protein [Flavobacteriaceae bacterium]|nr:DUF5011 domain-containing protein [Flavobacteriaceae bacterium]